MDDFQKFGKHKLLISKTGSLECICRQVYRQGENQYCEHDFGTVDLIGSKGILEYLFNVQITNNTYDHNANRYDAVYNKGSGQEILFSFPIFFGPVFGYKSYHSIAQAKIQNSDIAHKGPDQSIQSKFGIPQFLNNKGCQQQTDNVGQYNAGVIKESPFFNLAHRNRKLKGRSNIMFGLFQRQPSTV